MVRASVSWKELEYPTNLCISAFIVKNCYIEKPGK